MRHIMSTEELALAAPSIFASNPSPRVSEEYKFVNSVPIIDVFRDMDYYPVMARQTRTRKAERHNYTKHMVLFRHRAFLNASYMSEIPEILFSNAHDGTAKNNFDIAVFRMICSNGLIVKSNDFGSYSVKHSGPTVLEDVANAINSITEYIPRLLQVIEDWRKVSLSYDDREQLAKDLLMIRYENLAGSPITPSTLWTNVRRPEDTTMDLWATFNMFQENIMKGGLSSGYRGDKRLRSTRAIRGVSETIRFNKEAWEVADRLFKRLTNADVVDAIEV